MRRTSLATSLLLATIIALGFGPVWGFVASSLIDWVLPSSPRPSSFMVRQDGTPLLMQMDPVSRSYFLTDLKGQPVDDNLQDPSMSWVSLEPLRNEQRLDLTWRQRVREFSDLRSRPTRWFLISDAQPHPRAYFVGYDVASKYRVGFMAKDGFRESLPPVEDRFPLPGRGAALDNWVVSLQNQMLLPLASSYGYSTMPSDDADEFKKWQLYLFSDDQHIYEIDLRARTVSVAFTAPHIESCQLYSKNSKSPMKLIVRTDRQLLVLNRQHKVERTYAIPDVLASRAFRWGEVAPDQALALWTVHSLSVADNGSETIAWFNQAGHVTRRETGPARITAWLNTTISLACPVLVIVGLVVTCIYPYELLNKGVANSWSVAQGAALQEAWPALLFVTILSVFLAFACYRRQLRYAVTPVERTAWPIFVFLGGLPVWVGYRFGRRWPVLDHCPECGAEVPRNRETCAACRQEFPLPERQGFEILTA